MIDNKDLFLTLVRLGIGHETVNGSPVTVHDFSATHWPAIKKIAERHGLSAVVLDGIERLPEYNRPPKMLLLGWIGEVLNVYEQRYQLYEQAHGELAGFYHTHGFRMMVLKGYACSLNWPKPSHRPCGDMDIWLFGRQKEADELLAKEKGIEIDDSHEHHTVFSWRDFIVENHYDFIDTHHRKSSSQLEAIFKKHGQDDSLSVDVYSEKIYFPSANLHALFLLRHAMEHFASTCLTLRQLLDWAFFVKKHSKEVDWDWLLGVLEEFGMQPAFNIFNTICVEDLGFDSALFPEVQFNPFLKERVLCDILIPEFSSETPSGMLPRVLFKYRRWKANGWKNELCFKESMWSAFWSGVWGHLLRPKSI